MLNISKEFINTLPISICVFDTKGNYQFYNKMFETTFIVELEKIKKNYSLDSFNIFTHILLNNKYLVELEPNIYIGHLYDKEIKFTISFENDYIFLIINSLQRLIDKDEIINEIYSLNKTGIWYKNLKSNEIYWSDEMYNIFGNSKSSKNLETDFYSAIFADDLIELQHSIVGAYQFPNEFIHNIFRIVVNNQTKIIQSKFKIVNKNNENICLIGMDIDITEKIEKSNQLQNSDNKFRAIIETSLAGIGISSIDERILFCNKALSDLLEYDNYSEIIGKTLKDIFHCFDRNIFLMSINENKHNYIEAKLKTKNNTIKNVLISTSSLEYNTGEKNIIAIVIDITDRKKTENELKQNNVKLHLLNKTLEEFVTIAAHDLRNPLRTISGFIQRIDKKYEEKDKKLIEYFNFIYSAISYMNKIIDDSLSYSKSTINVELNEISLNKCIDYARSIFPNDNIKNNIQKDYVIYGNEHSLIKVFQNLFDNGLKFNNREDSYIIVNLIELRNFLQIDIIDNGIGIDEKYFKKIFLLFERLHEQTEYEGTGMGLAVVDKILKYHKGYIKVNSKVNEGSIFSIFLPNNKN